MAALYGMCLRRGPVEIINNCIKTEHLCSNILPRRCQKNLYFNEIKKTVYIARFSTVAGRGLLLAKQPTTSQKDHIQQQEQSEGPLPSSSSPSDGASSLPLAALLREAEENQKKRQEDEAKNKAKGKKGMGKAQKIAFGFFAVGSIGAALVSFYEMGQPLVDENGNKIPDEYDDSFILYAYFMRGLQGFKNYRKMIVEPSAEKLLPDPLTEPYYQPPYTLVLEMTNVLVHPEWTYSTGWRFKKRPGVDYFLQQIGPPLFEVVIYTREMAFTAYPLLDSLDPQGYIMYRLFRDATKYANGTHIKDLSCLNRDLSKVIMIDCNADAFQIQPRNGVALKKWEGDDSDRTLFDLAVFLRTIASSGVEDVRPVLDFYNKEDDPLETFRRNQARLQEEQEQLARFNAEKRSKDTSQIASNWQKGFFGSRR
ncbi:mitochondrial import inner membrane translocase subunit TIM50-like [Anneissia japonica]|uniref:mitochondrial import inner membrane translocase subunit TIM50-like n=1 Tax=Anneissia japonica TaxID=1529436 RepID=UPI001425533C|nr:mitochondrial import inner membrane translocase subunit TIM50-like [Anneissia japonica]